MLKNTIKHVQFPWEIPAKINSDNGTPFVNETITQVSEFLSINLRQYCVYHPASGGCRA